MIHVVSLFELFIVFVTLILIVAAYVFIYRILAWKRNMKEELYAFKEELRKEIGIMDSEEKREEASRIDLRPSVL